MLGIPELRQALAEINKRFQGLDVDWQAQVMVTTGATEARAASILALIEPGDEAVVFKPLYDSYMHKLRRAGAEVKLVHLRPPPLGFESTDVNFCRHVTIEAGVTVLPVLALTQRQAWIIWCASAFAKRTQFCSAPWTVCGLFLDLRHHRLTPALRRVNQLFEPVAGVAQLVRALDCGSRGRGFNPPHSPHSPRQWQVFSQ